MRSIFGIRLLLVISLLSNTAPTFYVYTNDKCEPCLERYVTVRELFPETVFVKYELAEKIHLKRFNDILCIFNDVLLSVPIWGIASDKGLKVIVAGEISKESWESILNEEKEGIPIYVGDGTGKAELKKIIIDMEERTNLEALFKGTKTLDLTMDFRSLIVPVSIVAVMDAVNPCAISVLLVMLSVLFYSSERGVVLSTGIAFSGAVFITYLLMGLGLIRAFSDLSSIRYVAVAFALVLGCLSILEFITGERKHIPDAFAKQITKYLERVSNPRTGFFAGIVVAALLLPCSSAPYFLAVNLISEKATQLGGFLLLTIYNLIIIAPLLIITFFIHTLALQTMNAKLWISEKKRWINLLLGLGLICMSLYILLV
ncbi:hypothetical protein ES703_47937 [subsurface metagenome]